MPSSIVGIWNVFERWARRYKQVGREYISHAGMQGFFHPGSALFVNRHHEINYDPFFDLNLDEDTLSDRLEEKIAFLRGYLVDISFDGRGFL